MRTAFIVFAIFVAAVLLVRFAAPAAAPNFRRAERITGKALLRNIYELGKRCAVTEYGQGVRHDGIKIRNIISDGERRIRTGAADPWQYLLINGRDRIMSAFASGKAAARQSAYCGHVGKYPRVYLFCERVIRDSGCDITCDMLLQAVSEFEKNSEFTLSERKILCGMLRFCLIGYLYKDTSSAQKCADEYDRGKSDGANGNVNLDCICEDDYVCGLVQACSEHERAVVERLLEHNGVDAVITDIRRRKRLARTYTVVNSVLRSLKAIDDCENTIYASETHGSERVKRYVKAFNITLPMLLAVYAVVTCIFASPKYVALFSVASIITYGVMRIPVLMYSPTSGIDIFSPIEAFLRKSANSAENNMSRDNMSFLSETAYFGSEPQYIQTVIDGAGIKVCCDNRGGILLRSDAADDRVCLGINSGGIDIGLSECDGVVERHRIVYHACKGDMELCVEAVAPIDGNLCVLRIAVINRSDHDIIATVTGAVIRKRSKRQKCYTQNIRGGAMAVCENSFALSLSGGSYGGDLHAFCADGTLRHGDMDAPTLIGRTTINVKRFARAQSYMTVMYASRTQAENMFEYVNDEKYFDRTVECAQAYCMPRAAEKQTGSECTLYTERKQLRSADFFAPALAETDYDYVMPFGGISKGDVVIECDRSHKPIDNNISGGELSIGLNQFGIQDISFGGINFTAEADKYAYSPRAFVVLGENGVIWSPTEVSMSGEKRRVIHSKGYSEYTCAYNGMVCVQKCFTAIGKPIALFDISLYNYEAVDRVLDIMFSAVCDSGVNVAISDDGVTADAGKHKLLLYAVGNRAEYAVYKEAYYVYGKIDRTCGFRAGGCTPAPTASVGVTVKSNADARVVFCVSEEGLSEKFTSIAEADRLFDAVKRFYARLGRIRSATDDDILNASYTRSLYCAYCAFAMQKNMPLYSECFILNAAKYADPSAVKNRIYSILREQNLSGLIGADSLDCLQAVWCIIEYAEFMQDDRFWSGILPYLPSRVHGKRVVIKDTVANHVLRAIEYLMANPLPNAESIVQSAWQYKNMLHVLRFAENKTKFNEDLYEQYKICLTKAADKYSREINRLTANNFFRFGSVAEAYLCARLLFDCDLNEKAYNIIKFNNPIERILHYGDRSDMRDVCYFAEPVSSAIYFTTVSERLFGVKFRGKTLKIRPHTAQNTPSLKFDILGKNKDARIIVDGSQLCGNWRMTVNKINYPADSVEIRNLSDDIVFYRDGSE